MDRDDYTLKAAEKQAILRALRKTRGNRRDAAELLQCGKTTLYRKIESYGLKREDWECIPISELPDSPAKESKPEPETLEVSQPSEKPASECLPNGNVPTSDELAMGGESFSEEFPITGLG